MLHHFQNNHSLNPKKLSKKQVFIFDVGSLNFTPSRSSCFAPERSHLLKNIKKNCRQKHLIVLSNTTLEGNVNIIHNKKNMSTSYSKLHELKLINIGLASPKRIKQWAEKTLPNGKILGQVTNANTLHHKTLKPQKGGLFCERLFGPLKDFECACGKNKKPNEEKQQQIFEHQQLDRSFCPKCDVEYTWSVIRRYQLGYIQLVSPVTHAWYLKATPSYLSILLDIKKRHLEYIIYSSETMTLEYTQKLTEQNFNSPANLFQIWQKSIINITNKKNKKSLNNTLENVNSVELKTKIASTGQLFSTPSKSNLPTKNLKTDPHFPIKKTFIEPKRWLGWRKNLYDFNKITSYTSKLNQIITYKNKFYNINKTVTNQSLSPLLSKKHILYSDFGNMNENTVNHNSVSTSSLFQLNMLPKAPISPFPTEEPSVMGTNSSKKSSYVDSEDKRENGPLIPVMIYILTNIQRLTTKKSILMLTEEIFKQFYTKVYNAIYNKLNKFLAEKNKNFRLSINNKIKNTLKIYLIKRIRKFYPHSLKVTQSFLNLNRVQAPEFHSSSNFAFPSPERAKYEPGGGYHASSYEGSSSNSRNMISNEKTRTKKITLYKKFLYNVMSKYKFLFIKNIRLKNKFEFFSLLNRNSNSRNVISKSSHSNNTCLKDFFKHNKIILEHTIKKLLNNKLNLSLVAKKVNLMISNTMKDNTFFAEAHTSPFLHQKGRSMSLSEGRSMSPFVLHTEEKFEKVHKFSFQQISSLYSNSENLQRFGILLNKSYNQKIDNNTLDIQNKYLGMYGFFNNYATANCNCIIGLTQETKLNIENYIYCLDVNQIAVFLKNAASNIVFKYTDKFVTNYSKNIYKTIIKDKLKERFFICPEYKYLNKIQTRFIGSQLVNKLAYFSNIIENLNAYVFFKNNMLEFQQLKNNEINYFNRLETQIKHKNLLPNLNIKRASNFSTFDKSLTNNIYCLSHRYRWSSEKDWKQFVDYFGAAPEFNDIPIPIYKYRIANSENIINQNGLTGTILIQKLLKDFHFTELKKIDKQNRILLYELNKNLIKLKKLLKKTYADRHKKKLFKELYRKRDALIRRTKLIRKLFRKDSRAESMILSVLPVLPPDLRPIIKVGGQIAASDLNRLYQRVIYRNERLKKFLKDPATINSYEMKYAQRLLQEAVDNLIQNGNSGLTAEKDSRGRMLKSLSDVLKGKQGRFRQHLLGKRVDYSGRSVIVVGPKLKLYECGLPKEMALELFLPFIIKKMISLKLARTVIGAKTLIKNNKELTYDILREIMRNHPILLNRAPTLHRLGIQAFQPKLIDGRAILLHPLVCPAFNADFDGDQMAVHVPITVESRVEAWKLMFSRNNLLSPATGEPLVLPSQDMVLGCYYLTTENRKIKLTEKMYFSNLFQVLKAYKQGQISLHRIVWVRYDNIVETGTEEEQPIEIRVNRYGYSQEIYKNILIRYDSSGKKISQFIRTTPGRILFNNLIQNSINLK